MTAHDAESGFLLCDHDYLLPTIVSPLAAGDLFFIFGTEFIVDEEGEDDVFLVEARSRHWDARVRPPLGEREGRRWPA